MYQTYPIAGRQARERFDFFRGVVDSVFCPMQIEVDRKARTSFEATLEATDLGRMTLARVSTTALLVRRRPQDIARISDPPYLVKFQLRGESLWSQRGRDVHMRPGDFVICSTAEPYSLRFSGEHTMPVLVVAQSIMRRLTPDPDRFLGLRMAGDEADCGLLSSFVAQVAARMSRLPEQIVNRVEANVLDLLGAVLTARTPPDVAPRPRQLERIKTYIRDHLHERGLGPGTIAAALGVSARYVHAVFATEGITVGRYIRSRRAAACRATLERGTPGRSLTDVALSWGYYDLSHMTRCFREEFGTPPRRFLLQLRDRDDEAGSSLWYKPRAVTD